MAKTLVLMSGGVDSSTAAALLVREGYEVSGMYLKLWDPVQPVISTKRPEGAHGEISHTATKDGMRSLDYASPAFGSARDDKRGIGDPCWAQEMRDASRVAAHLGIPFSVWDVTAEYKKRVLENFYSEYAAGRTPNPDVLCNSEIKFGVALKRALAAGFDYVATGHYARVHNPSQPASPDERASRGGPPLNSDALRGRSPTEASDLRGGESENAPPLKLRGGEGELWTAVDKNKDQSYFLWRLTQNQLAHVMFPIGGYTKPQVREMAREFGLHNWNKKDSQGVCFLGKIELKDFLYGDAPPLTPPRQGGETNQFPPLSEGRLGGVRKSGPIVDVHGILRGFHDGLAHFTIGQRHGTKLGGTGPYYVVEKDLTTNTLVVVHESEEMDYRVVECTVRAVNWIGPLPISPPTEGRGISNQFPSLDGRDEGRVMARTRYRAPLAPVVIARSERSERRGDLTPWNEIATLPSVARNDDIWRVIFKEPYRAVAPGQSIVFYDGDTILGGGIIDKTYISHPERSEEPALSLPKGSPTYVGRAFARDSSPAAQNDT